MSGQIPPQDPETEAVLLGACLESMDAYDRAFSVIGANSGAFFVPQHVAIWEAMRAIAAKGDNIEPLGIRHVMQSRKTYNPDTDQVISDMYSAIQRNRGRNIERIAAKIVDLHMKRVTIDACTRALTACYESGSEAHQIKAALNDKLAAVDNPESGLSFVTMQDASEAAFQRLEARQAAMAKGDRTIVGQPTGITLLDYYTGGDMEGDLISVAARPGGGKSTFAINGALAGAKAGYPQGVICLEMDNDMQVYRVYAAEAHVSNGLIQQARLKAEDWAKITKARAVVDKLPIYFDYCPSLDIHQLESKIRAMVRKGVKRVYLDYLQLMDEPADGQSRKQFENDDRKIGQITKRLKQLAGSLKISIVILCQMNREVDKRAGEKVPIKSDLRGSGNIEQDSVKVFFLYTPYEYEASMEGYCRKWYPMMDIEDMMRLTFIIPAKQRNAGNMWIPIWNDRKYCLMSDIKDRAIYGRLKLSGLFDDEPELVKMMGWTLEGQQQELDYGTDFNDETTSKFPF